MLTTKQVAEILGVHPETIRRKVIKGEIKAVRLSKTDYRFKKEDIEHAFSIKID